MTGLRFTKMHGLGNDYILLNGSEEHIADPAALARVMCDRHIGVGADGLILVLPPEEGIGAHVRMRMFNADGSEAEMCGNGIRCLCKQVIDRGLADARPLHVQTKAGVLALDYTLDAAGQVGQITVDMGEPALELEDIPVNVEALARPTQPNRVCIEIGGQRWIGVVVSMGNPHIVFFDDDHPELMPGGPDRIDPSYWGPRIEHHPAFPQRINAHWVRVASRREVIMRTWERGSGATLACGTGAAATCVAGFVSGRTERHVRARLPGGALALSWDGSTNHVFMTGPAAEVFNGEWGVLQGAQRR
jgi:diaminopimelate epimerase